MTHVSARGKRLRKYGSKESILPEAMTTKEFAQCLRVHEILVCKHAAAGRIPGKRVVFV